MPTDQERAELIAQLLKLLDEIEAMEPSMYIRTRIAIAKDMARKLAEPSKPDGGDGHEAA